jgi:hypothetical protein
VCRHPDDRDDIGPKIRRNKALEAMNERSSNNGQIYEEEECKDSPEEWLPRLTSEEGCQHVQERTDYKHSFWHCLGWILEENDEGADGDATYTELG